MGACSMGVMGDIPGLIETFRVMQGFESATVLQVVLNIARLLKLNNHKQLWQPCKHMFTSIETDYLWAFWKISFAFVAESLSMEQGRGL